ncbi:MAG: hypothetical protein U1B83_01765 [Candidatus Cloacimonadaceae bacterium]|nr:hypothetical protein [Candidatus Cloacimonadaceae bacterium]
MNETISSWLLSGDVAIQYHYHRDLMGLDLPDRQQRIATEGWGKQLLEHQDARGHWGLDYYRPKWCCTHYTLLELKEMGLAPGIASISDIVNRILDEQKARNGGITFWKGYIHSDLCVDGMVLNYASYFLSPDARWNSLIDLLLSAQMSDGGWNCRWRHKAVHSSFHTTISVLEGLWQYRISGATYRMEEISAAEDRAIEFLLQHHLYKSHRTLETVDPKMTLFSYPARWRYDVLRALYHFAQRRVQYDERMQDALLLVKKKRSRDGAWVLQNRHPGKAFFHMERVGQHSRWNTLRALQVLDTYPMA